MLGELLIFVGLICSLVAPWFVIRWFSPVVWDADIKPFIREFLGPRR